jgi:hypothetical protein
MRQEFTRRSPDLIGPSIGREGCRYLIGIERAE